MTIQQWYIIGTALTGVILTHPKLPTTPDIQIAEISKDEVEAFFRLTSVEVAVLKRRISENVKYDDQYVYTFNPLEYSPLVRIGDLYYCPLITLLIWRMTSGIYFDLVNANADFANPFGRAFQSYLEEVAETALKGSRVKVLPEKPYLVGRQSKDSVDLILLDEQSAIFVEAKAKRMVARSKSELLTDDAIQRDLDILADDVVQAYKTIDDYKNGHYPHLEYNSERAIYPFIITLEEWFLIGEDLQRLEGKVGSRLSNQKLPETCLTEMPYTICSCRAYEDLVSILRKRTIDDIVETWFVPENKGHHFGQHLLTTYPGEHMSITKLFPREFERILSTNTT